MREREKRGQRILRTWFAAAGMKLLLFVLLFDGLFCARLYRNSAELKPRSSSRHLGYL